MYAKLHILYNVLSFHCFPLFSKTVRQEAWEKLTKYLYDLLLVSPERRCSSRTFRYGYLVTT